MLRIWLNRTYATQCHTISLFRRNPDDVPVEVIATHVDPDSPVMLTADEIEPESPDLDGPAFVEWALDLCARRRIDVFQPGAHAADVSRAADAFAAAGVALVVAPAESIELLADKATAYEQALEAGVATPPWRVVMTGDELLAAYDELAVLGPVVLKPTVAVGGAGYRLLTREPLTRSELTGHLRPRQRLDEAVEALGSDNDRRLLVMPHLTGPELSVDTLADREGRLVTSIPRIKHGRRRSFSDDPAVRASTKTIVERHHLSYLSNTQFRYWRHPDLDHEPRPYLLETNVRMSGGLFQTQLAGVNLPWAAIQIARGESVTLNEPTFDRSFVVVSSLADDRSYSGSTPTSA